MHVLLWNERFVSLHRAHEGVAEERGSLLGVKGTSHSTATSFSFLIASGTRQAIEPGHEDGVALAQRCHQLAELCSVGAHAADLLRENPGRACGPERGD